MTTFRKTPVKLEIAGDEPLSDYARGYLSQRVRNSFYDYVMRRFQEAVEQEDMTKTKLAKRLGVTPSRVTRLLGSPSNWTLGTVSELLVGICREELRPTSEPFQGRATRNRQPKDLLQLGDIALTEKKRGSQTSPTSSLADLASLKCQGQAPRIANIRR